MTISRKLKDYLDQENIKYELSEHAEVYTAQETAGTGHIPGRQMAKSVIVKAGDGFLMCVLPSIHLIDFDKLKEVTGHDKLELAAEDELEKLFPDYDLGAEPPFGHLYGLKVYMDQLFEENEEIAFNAGTHTDIVKIKFADYKRLAHPEVVNIGTHI